MKFSSLLNIVAITLAIHSEGVSPECLVAFVAALLEVAEQ
ncbi:hypothetical protein Rsw2DRAFT_1639 [Rhodobacter ferrooxidans]|uniref:Uncharacterized protein n=1 Tax=Rhodobacter ferrooxidans TaxID=371731 RepID=C8S0R1_9RHOB|nr:hypothetical protein Rsw2DRAFT_1639 [Rhodobacter sp. SW2]